MCAEGTSSAVIAAHIDQAWPRAVTAPINHPPVSSESTSKMDARLRIHHHRHRNNNNDNNNNNNRNRSSNRRCNNNLNARARARAAIPSG